MFHLLTDDVRREPFPLYAELRSASPLLAIPGTDLFAIFDYDSVKRALTDHETFGSAVAAGQPGKWLIFLDPPRHTRLRALVMRAFSGPAVASLEPRVRSISGALLDRVEPRGEMELIADYALPLPLMVIAELLGAPADDWPTFRRWSDVLLELIHTLEGGERAARAEAAFAEASREMRAYLEGLVEPRRVAPREDLLSRLVHAEVDGARLDDDDLLGFFQLLLLAGHETTTNLVANAVLSFLQHPAELARVRDAPALLPSAIEEVLRHRSPVQAVFRAARRDVELHGQVVPRGSRLIVVVGSANRDPKVFRDPDRFDVARDPNPHVAFGHGIHFCVGAPLARLEARVALGDLLARFEDVAHASDEPWAPRPAFHVHGPTRLPLRFRRVHAPLRDDATRR